MRLWAATVGVAGIVAAFIGQPQEIESWTIVIGGDLQGYLSPCGCTSPMSGGIRRWCTAVKAVTRGAKSLILENGGFVAGDGKQDRYKAEALAQALAGVNVTAINLTSSEAALGAGEVSELSQLSGEKFVSTSANGLKELQLSEFIRKGPFLIGGAVDRPSMLSSLATSALSPDEAAKRLVARAAFSGLAPVLMLQGDRHTATRIAESAPGLRLIVYSQAGDPPSVAVSVGNTILVSPGERGKFLVKLNYVKNKFSGYTVEDLGPIVKDDKEASLIYGAYLRNVDRENLIDSWFRVKTEPYSGSTRCGACHQAAFTIWKASKHHGALTDLRGQGHGRDPDCVVCHVTALGSDHGYRDMERTPDLAYVGCESCHGPGDKHSTRPNEFAMPKVGKESCTPCHESNNSPNFEFLTYWSRIRHG